MLSEKPDTYCTTAATKTKPVTDDIKFPKPCQNLTLKEN